MSNSGRKPNMKYPPTTRCCCGHMLKKHRPSGRCLRFAEDNCSKFLPKDKWKPWKPPKRSEFQIHD